MATHHSVAPMIPDAIHILRTRDLTVGLMRATSPNLRADPANRATMTHDDRVVATAAEIQPNHGISPSASTAFMIMDHTAKRNGVFVSSRAKNKGCSSFCKINAGRPKP